VPRADRAALTGALSVALARDRLVPGPQIRAVDSDLGTAEPK
jgi:hypothetical protein